MQYKPPYSKQWTPALIQQYESIGHVKNHAVYVDVINNKLQTCIQHDPDNTFWTEDVYTSNTRYILHAATPQPNWQIDTGGGGISSRWPYASLAAIEAGAMLDSAGDPNKRANTLTVLNVVNEFDFSGFVSPEDPDLYDGGAIAYHWSNERWTANDRGYGKRRDPLDISSLIRAATPGTEQAGGQALGMQAASEFIVDSDTTYGAFTRHMMYFPDKTQQFWNTNQFVDHTMIDPARGDARFTLAEYIKVKAMVIHAAHFLGTGMRMVIGDMTITLFGQEERGAPLVPILVNDSESNVLTVPAGTYYGGSRHKYCFQFNARVSFPFITMQFAGDKCSIRGSGADQTRLRIFFVEDNNNELISPADTRYRVGADETSGWSSDSLLGQQFDNETLHTYHPRLEYNYKWQLNGRWQPNHVSSYEVSTGTTAADATKLFDENYAAENNRFISAVAQAHVGTLFSAGTQYSRSVSRARSERGHVGHVCTSGSTAPPTPVSSVVKDPTIRALDPNTPFIEVLGFAFVTQGTGVVDPDHFTESVIDLLDANQDLLITINVDEVFRAFSDEEWEASQRLTSNDCLFFRFDITPFPTAAYYTFWSPNLSVGTPYQSTKTSGFYQTLSSDLTTINRLVECGYDPRRSPTMLCPIKKYVGNGKYENTGKMARVLDNKRKEKWHVFYKRMERLHQLMLSNREKITPQTLVCSENIPLGHEIPRNTMFVDITVSETSNNPHAAVRRPELRALRTPIHQLYSRHNRENSEDLAGNQSLRGEVTVATRPRLFRKPDGKITFRFRVMANTHPRVYPGKIAHYNVWHTKLLSVKLANSMSVVDVQFVKTGILTKETEPNGIHEEVWHTKADNAVQYQQRTEESNANTV
jgi:hypothetical protein